MITYIIITIVTGILLGFATSARTPADGLEDLVRNIVVGMAGAFVGLQVVGRTFDSAGTGVSAITLALASITGATIMLLIVNKVRRA